MSLLARIPKPIMPENSEIPASTDGYAVTNGIRRIAHEYGGVKVFKAYCDTPEMLTPRSATMRADLHACGVSVIDCPHNGRKDTADKKMMGACLGNKDSLVLYCR